MASVGVDGKTQTPIYLLRQKGWDLASVVSYPVEDARVNDSVDPDRNLIRAIYTIRDTNALDRTVQLLSQQGGKTTRDVLADDFLMYAATCKGVQGGCVAPELACDSYHQQ